MKNLLESYGIDSMKSTRAYIINLIGLREQLNLRQLSILLFNNENIMFDYPKNYTWKSTKHRSKNFWKSTEIFENLQALWDYGIIENLGGMHLSTTSYKLTPEGTTIYCYIADQTHQGENFVCPKCGNSMAEEYEKINYPIDATGRTNKSEYITLSNFKKENPPFADERTTWTINIECSNCKHHWQEEGASY